MFLLTCDLAMYYWYAFFVLSAIPQCISEGVITISPSHLSISLLPEFDLLSKLFFHPVYELLNVVWISKW